MRKCKCADCRRELLPGEGVAYEYLMFHGNGCYYYCCPACDTIRKQQDLAEREAKND